MTIQESRLIQIYFHYSIYSRKKSSYSLKKSNRPNRFVKLSSDFFVYYRYYDIIENRCTRSVAANIGFSVDSDLHEKSLHRIRYMVPKPCRIESICVCFRSIVFLFSVQNQFFVCSKILLPILHGITVI
jgi:hypothetical protein